MVFLTFFLATLGVVCAALTVLLGLVLLALGVAAIAVGFGWRP